MKNFTLLVVLLALATALLSKEQPPRMQLAGEQYHSPGGHSVEFWHDSETGQEVICIYGALNVPSCYLTGRAWK